MDLKLEICGLCAPYIFIINGVRAYYNDFGDKYDHDTESAECFGCGDMRFDGEPSTPEILDKYSITQSEYDEIVLELSEKLSFGSCGGCV